MNRGLIRYMRYELYRLCKVNATDYCYDFQKESDDIEDLFRYVLCLNIKKVFEGVNCGQQQWIYLDNEPSNFNILHLGYTTVPTEKECAERIFQCKFQKHLNAIVIENIDNYDFYTYLKDYEEIAKVASAECDAICVKLFTYEPIICVGNPDKIYKPLRNVQ
jgi:hypothetical protein